MGMFDNIICKVPLPNGGALNQNFQTKDLSCTLSDYTITEDGRLVHDEWHYEPTPKEQLDPKCPWLGCLTRVIDRPNVDMNYHGILHFYGDDDYYAKFTDGTLVEIVCADPKENSNV